MDFIGYECPACSRNFHADDDIVVCPHCGTPHHRECYEKLGECFNKSKHDEGYDFEKEERESTTPEGAVKCSACGEINDEGAFFCKKCNKPLIDMANGNQQNTQANQNTQNQGNPMGGMPFGGSPTGTNPTGPFGANAFPQFDPMGGVSPDLEFENGVKAGEAAKYVKQNTPYFMQVFNRIKSFGKSKFSFSGMLFGGGYLLYRKQYVLGTIITAIMAVCLLFSTYVNYTVLQGIVTEVMDANANITTYTQLIQAVTDNVMSSDTATIIMIIASFICNIIYYGLHLTCGFIANRCYYKHCCKAINKIKENAPGQTVADNELQTKGGVNTALGLSLLVVAMIINFLPQFLFIS